MPRRNSRPQLERDVHARLALELEGHFVGIFYGEPLVELRGPAEGEDEYQRYRVILHLLKDNLAKLSLNDLRRLAQDIGAQPKAVGRRPDQIEDARLLHLVAKHRKPGWSVPQACRWLAVHHYGRKVSVDTLIRRFYRAKKRLRT